MSVTRVIKCSRCFRMKPGDLFSEGQQCPKKGEPACRCCHELQKGRTNGERKSQIKDGSVRIEIREFFMRTMRPMEQVLEHCFLRWSVDREFVRDYLDHGDSRDAEFAELYLGRMRGFDFAEGGK